MARRTLVTIAVALMVGLLSPAAATAGSVTIMWDPNTEPDLAGYLIRWGTQSGVYTSIVDVGNRTTWSVAGLQDGTRYYFTLQAYNLSGLRSEDSAEVSAVVNNAVISVDDWKQKFGVSDLSADDDGDGVDNAAEYTAGTDPTLPNTWMLAEGSTGFFKERIALANPGTDEAQVTISYLLDGGAPIVQEHTIAPRSRLSVNVNDVPGLANATASAVITASKGGVVAERTMFWANDSGDPYAGHTAKAVQRPLTRWYFAEGDASAFETWLLISNANATPVTLDVTYYPEGGTPIRKSYAVGASARFTIYTNQVPGLGRRPFSTVVEASAPVTAERSMYMSAHSRFWKIGHSSAGVEAPSTIWYVAEGSTAWIFDQYLLLQNPNPQPATATIRFLLSSGSTVVRSYALAAQSRTTVWVDGEPGLASADASATITADLPIVVERAMYWPAGNWHEGHASAGLTRTGVKWALAEGENGGPSGFQSYVLVANPGDADAIMRVTLLPADGTTPAPVLYTVRAHSRFTLGPGDLVDGGRQFGALIEAVNEVPIVVERSMYWNALGQPWAGGTNETGVRLR